MSTLIKNVSLVNEGQIRKGNLLIDNGLIAKIDFEDLLQHADNIIEGKGLHLLPGLIDDQVHFREPGLTHKATIFTESRAAVAGGITSFMEMPNTVPNVLTQELLEDKYAIAAEDSIANYSFYMGAGNDNLDEVLKTDPKSVCGVKVFMGSSTGNMLVDNRQTLQGLFAECPMLIATHCEDEATIRANTAVFRKKCGEDVPVKYHPQIRSAEACYKSSSMAVELASKYNTRLHVLHISTARETTLFEVNKGFKDKRITAEACVHHLWFSEEDYEKKGSLIKWNPAVKTANDRAAILKAVLDNRIDVLATDHAPHTLEEKQNSYFKAPSGGPLVQHCLLALLDLYHQNKIDLATIVQKSSHNVAELFQIKNRGYLREGYAADLVLVDLEGGTAVSKSNVLSKCGWSPFEGHEFKSAIKTTFVNGNPVYSNGLIIEGSRGARLNFDR